MIYGFPPYLIVIFQVLSVSHDNKLILFGAILLFVFSNDPLSTT